VIREALLSRGEKKEGQNKKKSCAQKKKE